MLIKKSLRYGALAALLSLCGLPALAQPTFGNP
jgi:hypothetical protein